MSNLFSSIIEKYIKRIEGLSDWLGIGTNADYAKKSIEIREASNYLCAVCLDKGISEIKLICQEREL